jgi:hypothetical protein
VNSTTLASALALHSDAAAASAANTDNVATLKEGIAGVRTARGHTRQGHTQEQALTCVLSAAASASGVISSCSAERSLKRVSEHCSD